MKKNYISQPLDEKLSVIDNEISSIDEHIKELEELKNIKLEAWNGIVQTLKSWKQCNIDTVWYENKKPYNLSPGQMIDWNYKVLKKMWEWNYWEVYNVMNEKLWRKEVLKCILMDKLLLEAKSKSANKKTYKKEEKNMINKKVFLKNLKYNFTTSYFN